MKYAIFIGAFEDSKCESVVWFAPSKVDPRFTDIEPTLGHAIKAERYFRRMFGFQTKRESIA